MIVLLLLAISTTSRAQAQTLPANAPSAPACISDDHRNDRRLAFGIRGRLQRLAVTVGDRVKPGARLARLNCSAAEADLQIATGELEIARAEYGIKKSAAQDGELIVAQARLRTAQLALQDADATDARLKQLAGKAGVVSQPELSDVARRIANAQLDVAIAQNNLERISNPLTEPQHEYWRTLVKAREAAVRRAQLQIENCDVRAPLAGIVTEIRHYEGEFVDALEPVLVLRTHHPVDTQ